MEIEEVYTLEDLKKFLDLYGLSMTMHYHHTFMVTIQGRSMFVTGEGPTFEAALKDAWGKR